MTDWLLPNEDELFIGAVLQELKDRDFDSASLFLNVPSAGLITGIMRYVRASNKFQEWNGSAWVDKILSLAGGGTSAATAADARTNLGLGTIVTQDFNNVNITGGNLAGSGSGITNLNADNLASGIVPDARFPATLPAIGGVNLTSLNASNLTTGTVPDARFPGTLPALNGSLLTALNGSNIASGTVAAARLGSGASITTKFLRGDNTWQDITVIKSVRLVDVTLDLTNPAGVIDFSPVTTNYLKAWISMASELAGNTAPNRLTLQIINNSQVAWQRTNQSGSNASYRLSFYIIEAS